MTLNQPRSREDQGEVRRQWVGRQEKGIVGQIVTLSGHFLDVVWTISGRFDRVFGIANYTGVYDGLWSSSTWSVIQLAWPKRAKKVHERAHQME